MFLFLSIAFKCLYFLHVLLYYLLFLSSVKLLWRLIAKHSIGFHSNHIQLSRNLVYMLMNNKNMDYLIFIFKTEKRKKQFFKNDYLILFFFLFNTTFKRKQKVWEMVHVCKTGKVQRNINVIVKNITFYLFHLLLSLQQSYFFISWNYAIM